MLCPEDRISQHNAPSFGSHLLFSMWAKMGWGGWETDTDFPLSHINMLLLRQWIGHYCSMEDTVLSETISVSPLTTVTAPSGTIKANHPRGFQSV